MNKQLQQPAVSSRRVFLAEGSRFVTLGGLAMLATALGLPAAAIGQDWGTLSRQSLRGGSGVVKSIRGSASAGGRPLTLGAQVNSGEKITTAVGAVVILSLSDNTIMRINGNTSLQLEIGANRSGIFKLTVGSLLTVMPTRNRYLVQLPTAVVGIKGTVFFQQIYHPGETTAVGMEQKRYTIPEGVREYFCLCNGAADFVEKGSMGTFFSDKAEHHNSYYIDPSRPNPLVKAPMVNHSDEQISQLIDLQDGPKHDSGFLGRY